MFATFTRALSLTWRQPARAWLLARMATWVVILSALVKLFPLPRALRFVAAGVRTNSNAQAVELDELSSAIDALLEMDVFMFKPNCWKRATVLHRYLALRGIATTIVFGLRKEPDGELKGHAWLESEGHPFLESEPPLYTITYVFPSAESFDGELALMGTDQREAL
ncbi:MAG TPA: lasso peptide biosynthesis B2 protein [Pyrinomonadaceae bacterium]|jgi:hypothetical protein|nr:lasso peptide biosynthesis B2 protein [Pyrinomonadaceae bacterium]